jgi:hypothetical protein
MTVPSVPTARVAAVAAIGAALGHLPLLLAHLQAAPVLAAGLFAMAAACLHCAWRLWRRATAAVWATAAVMSGGMMLVHVPGSPLAHGHSHGAADGAALAAVAAGCEVFLVLAAVAVLVRSLPRARACSR